MRTLSATIANILNATSPATYFITVSVGTTPGLYWTSLPVNATIGGNTYIAGKIVSISPIQMASVMDRSEYNIVVSDLDSSVEFALNAGGFSRSFIVRLGFFNPATGLPYLESNNFLTVYDGLVDSWAYNLDTEKRELMINGTNPLGALDFTNSIHTSPASVKRWDPNDTCFDFLGALSEEEVALRWGKK